MRKSTTAVLLSAFVFPGAGHLYLRRYVTGTVLAGGAGAALYYLLSQAWERALDISAKIQSGDVDLDVGVISDLLSRQPIEASAQWVGLATIGLTAFWLIGIVDSYRVGRIRDSSDARKADRL